MPETFIRGDFEEKVRQLFFESGLSRQAAAASFDLLKKQVLQNMRPDVQEVSPGNLLRGSPGNLMMYKKWCHASVTRYGPAWTSSGQYQFAAPSRGVCRPQRPFTPTERDRATERASSRSAVEIHKVTGETRQTRKASSRDEATAPAASHAVVGAN